jgi:predicted glycoside hydrolase/deacetylase ChbG (UPF0249 family)
MRGLIVNADDYGFSQEINEGVCEAHAHGIVTDASLLVRSPHVMQAVRLAAQVNLPLGLHIDFVSPFVAINWNELGPDGHLTHELYNREFNSRITSLFSTMELLTFQDELRKQIADFTLLVGYTPSHLDYHYGLHYLPDMMFIYLQVANQYHLPVRWAVQYAGTNPLVLAPARFCDRFRGTEDASVQTFIDLLHDPWEGALEMVCHPGYFTPTGLSDSYNQEREYELKILTDPGLKSALFGMGIQLVDFHWLQHNHSVGLRE